jgi:hypothetical protein
VEIDLTAAFVQRANDLKTKTLAPRENRRRNPKKHENDHQAHQKKQDPIQQLRLSSNTTKQHWLGFLLSCYAFFCFDFCTARVAWDREKPSKGDSARRKAPE